MGRGRHRALHGVYWPNQLHFRCRDVSCDVECVPREHCGETVIVPVWLVCSWTADANINRAYDPHAAYSVHSEPSRHARYHINRKHHGIRHLPAILIAGRAFGNGAAAVIVFWLAGGNSAQLLRAHATDQNNIHPSLQAMAIGRAQYRSRPGHCTKGVLGVATQRSQGEHAKHHQSFIHQRATSVLFRKPAGSKRSLDFVAHASSFPDENIRSGRGQIRSSNKRGNSQSWLATCALETALARR